MQQESQGKRSSPRKQVAGIMTHLSLRNLCYSFIDIYQDILRKCNRSPKAKEVHLESE